MTTVTQAEAAGQGEPIVPLTDAVRLGPDRVGTKAANLAPLAAAGLPVPPGFVVLPEACDAWETTGPKLTVAAEKLGPGLLAVRSSSTAEDLVGASYAGQYESMLNVAHDRLPQAVRDVCASAAAARVAAYRQARAVTAEQPETARMAVLVQTMVDADAAGVAFTANPVTGERGAVVVTAVRGVGERLVGGEAVGDEWVVRDAEAVCMRATEDAIDAAQARAVAALARQVEQHAGLPQDIEWAIAGGSLYLLQARPMTALPEPTIWAPPATGWWLRNMRLGEWLPEPVTPLCADWLLPAIEHGIMAGMRAEAGFALDHSGAFVNGWYYTTVQGRGSLLTLVSNILRHPKALRLVRTLALLLLRPEWAAADLSRRTNEWQRQLLPRYRALVTDGEQVVDEAAPPELLRLADRVAAIAGEYYWSLSMLAGSQWKLERALARFARAHLPTLSDTGYQALVIGLPGAEPELSPYAVHSIDWYWPTAGELGETEQRAEALTRRDDLAARRHAAEAQCQATLAGSPRLLRRFARLLALAQRYSVVREQQTRGFTLGWPLLRRCARRLGEHLCASGTLTGVDDVFFLTHAELVAAAAGRPSASLPERVQQRRSIWERQRRLVAPLQLGTPATGPSAILAATVESARTSTRRSAGALVGQPASPGRATGRVRVIAGPADFARFQAGEVLVARVTAPAWTPLFARAAAVVTDGGTLAAHASLVAREYGIPAVVGMGDATTRLRDGQLVTVDGGAGVVEVTAA
jgi:pyruvate,water dikinase